MSVTPAELINTRIGVKAHHWRSYERNYENGIGIKIEIVIDLNYSLVRIKHLDE
jgi:hypothetical protein